MRFLITNDDGVNAIGIKKLVEVAMKYGECIVVAPKVEQSGKSHSIYIRKELELKKIEDIFSGVETYSLDSTPADCVRVAHYYLHDQFDVVLSGVNNGYNIGDDIIYSGTCAAATEAMLIGKKALAFSTGYDDLKLLNNEIEETLKFILSNELLDKCDLYNINIPPKFKNIKFTCQGRTHYDAHYEYLTGNVKLIGRPTRTPDDIENSDVQSIYDGYASVTPLTFNRTDYNVLKDLLINHKINHKI